MPKKLKTLLSIAAADPTGGAGIQADIRSGIRLGLHVVTAITALTVQNSKKFSFVYPTSPEFLKDQLEAITEDVMPEAVKIGMVGSPENIMVIRDFIFTLPATTPVVIDPVLSASAQNNILLDTQGNYEWKEKLYIDNLFPLATVVTPNLPEFQALSRFSNSLTLGAKALVLKGGHSDDKMVTDTLITSGKKLEISNSRYDCRNLHGTGCTFSSLMASYIALGNSIEEAFRLTTSEMNKIISESCNYQLGNSDYGPLNINNYML